MTLSDEDRAACFRALGTYTLANAPWVYEGCYEAGLRAGMERAAKIVDGYAADDPNIAAAIREAAK